MGTILHVTSKKTVVLAAHSVVGRAPSSLVRLGDLATSHDHASISWNGSCWEVRDLASTNGTFINGERIPLKERIQLSRGAILQFGPETERWQLIDDGGPVVMARCLTTGACKTAQDGLLELPDEADVRVSIVDDADGLWFVEAADGSRHSAKSGESISIGKDVWTLVVPPHSPSVGTYKAKPQLSLTTLALRFHISQDEQHIRVDIEHGDDTIELGERSLFGVLLSLARRRLVDEMAASLPESERGWYDLPDLAYELEVDERVVNTNIHRLRRLFKQTGVEGGWNVVENRLKKRRIGTGRLLGL